MTVSVTNSSCTTKNSNHKTTIKQATCPQHLSASDEAEHYEKQEVQNLPFDSAKLKAQHSHWSERCSTGIQKMLTRRQHRHDAALQTYLDIRRSVDTQLQGAVAQHAVDCKQQLADSTAGISDCLSKVSDDNVMHMEEAAVHEVWSSVMQQVPVRSDAITQLGQAAEAAEQHRKSVIDAALLQETQAMNDIAHLSPGEVERLVEQQALDLNLSMLDNRKVYANLACQLMVAEVKSEEVWHAQFEAGLASWRTLRTQHALRLYNERLAGEWGEPESLLAIFRQLSQEQKTAYEAMASHLAKASDLSPPATSAAVAQQWVAAADQLMQQSASFRDAYMTKLKQCEEDVEQAVQTAFRELKQQALEYGGYPEAELQKLLEDHCSDNMQQRREHAQQLLAATQAVLHKQATAWSAACAAVGQLVTQLSQVHDRHKEGHAAMLSGIKQALEMTHQEFDRENGSKEAAFQAAITAVNQAASEQELDERVGSALTSLDGIEAWYRSYQASVLSLLRQHPGSIVSANAGYRQQLCSLLCMEAPSSLNQLSASSTPGANAAGVQGTGTTVVQPAVSGGVGGVVDPTAVGFVPPSGDSIVIGGVEFKPQLDMYVRCVAEPVAAAVATAEQTAADAAKAVAKSKADAAAAVVKAAADAVAAVAAAAADEVKPSKGGKDTKGGKDAKPAAADKGGKADKSGKADTKAGTKAGKAAADAAAAEPPQPEFEFEFEGVKAPRDRSGAVLCREEAVPEGAIRQALQTLQKQFLEDMVAFCEETESSGHSWAGEEEVAATEQLEARLRSHRPRAGRVEEEVRQARAVELIAQKRLLDLHMRSQSKALGVEQQEVAGAIAAAGEVTQQWLAKLRGMEQLLYSAQSAQFLDIRKREAEAYKDKLGRDLTAQTAKLSELITAASQKVLDANTKYAEDHLKGFEQEGKYATATIQQAQQQLKQVEDAVLAVRQQQLSSVEAAKTGTEAKAAEALETVLAAVPRHRQDLVLIEALDKALDGAKKAATKKFVGSTAAGGTIATQIAALQQLLQPQAEGVIGLALCEDVVSRSAALRAGLCARAQALQLLKASLVCEPIDMAVFATEGAPPKLPVGVPDAAACVAISTQIEAAVKACEEDTSKLGQDYYAALAASSPGAAAKRPPSASTGPAPARSKAGKDHSAAAESGSTRPERIPSTLAGLQELHRKTLQELQQQLQAHLTAAHQELRAQVVAVYRLLEAVPAVAIAGFTQNQLAQCAAARQAMAEPVQQQQQQLLQQFDRHRRALHPTMVQPSRQGEVSALTTAEQERTIQAIQLGQGHSQTALALIAQQGPAVRARLVRLTQLLLKLLDGFVMPGDFMGSGQDLQEAVMQKQGGESVSMTADSPAHDSSPKRRTLKQLQALALASAAAGGEGAASSPAAKSPAASAKAATAGKNSAKGGKDADLTPESSRAYAACQWHLAPPALSTQDLGWSVADTMALCAPSASPATDAATASSKGKSTVAAKKPSAAASTDKTAPATAVGQLAPMTDEIVNSLQTPCHVAAVQAHKAALEQLQVDLAAALSHLKDSMYAWQHNETANKDRWAVCLKSLHDVV